MPLTPLDSASGTRPFVRLQARSVYGHPCTCIGWFRVELWCPAAWPYLQVEGRACGVVVVRGQQCGEGQVAGDGGGLRVRGRPLAAQCQPGSHTRQCILPSK